MNNSQIPITTLKKLDKKESSSFSKQISAENLKKAQKTIADAIKILQQKVFFDEKVTMTYLDLVNTQGIVGYRSRENLFRERIENKKIPVFRKYEFYQYPQPWLRNNELAKVIITASNSKEKPEDFGLNNHLQIYQQWHENELVINDPVGTFVFFAEENKIKYKIVKAGKSIRCEITEKQKGALEENFPGGVVGEI